MQDVSPPTSSGLQPAASALLHLECDVPAQLQPLLARWWEDFHFAELLSLPGFLSARRGELIAPERHAPIVTMYGLVESAAADQPRPPEFTLLPSDLDGKVTFNRRILQRRSQLSSETEPVGSAFLQLLRPTSNAAAAPDAASRIRGWIGALSVSCWRSVANLPHTDREEVVHLRGAELIHVELADAAQVMALLARAAAELPEWSAGAYRQAYPAGGVMVPVPR